jgi:double zinc ribbon protein
MSSATLTEQARGQASSAPTPTPIAPDADAPSVMGAGHFFVVATALLSGATAIVLRQQSAAVIVLAGITVAAGGYAAYALYRSILPLVSGEAASDAVMVGGRTRAALERDKALTLRSLKELDFDHAMGKIAAGDYTEMRDRLRTRAIRLMRQLDGATEYRAQIERDLQARLGRLTTGASQAEAVAGAKLPPAAATIRINCAQCNTPNETDARFCKACGTAMPRPLPTCGECGTVGETDARFCKQCGHALLASV